MIKTYKTIEFDKVLNEVSEFALSNNAKDKILNLAPSLDERECKKNLHQTSEARKIIEHLGSPPLVSMKELEKILVLIEKGSMLFPEDFEVIRSFINSCKRMKGYLKKAESLEVNLSYYGMSFVDLSVLHDEIERCIRNEKVDNLASKPLQDARRKLENAKSSIKVKIDSVLKSKKNYLSDNNVVIRNGRFALPVKKEYKNQVTGSVVDISSSGGTIFIEPSSVAKLQGEINNLEIEEENEVRKVLYTLSALAEDYIKELKTNEEYMHRLDFIFAKAKYSIKINGIEAEITANRKIKMISARHPLLKKEECVPLDFFVGEGYNGIIITGPNTGGKTVALKTVGLLSLMAQSGLHVSAERGSVFSMNANVLCDIGDGQSITENLSTFSAHIKNIIAILEDVTSESLVLLDELGSGTDPEEGMGIAIAIIDELKRRGCLFLATTHYPEVKEYAKNTQGLINARMEFDKENLKPLYKLKIGEAGESCALFIAEKLGFPNHLLNRAKDIVGFSDNDTNQRKIAIDSHQYENEYKKSKSRIIKDIPIRKNEIKDKFSIGDSVEVLPEKHIGIIYKLADDKGDFVVIIRGEKKLINHTKLKLKVKKEELYPDDYDMSIVFDTTENRRARNKMKKRHDPNLIIKYDKLD